MDALPKTSSSTFQTAVCENPINDLQRLQFMSDYMLPIIAVALGAICLLAAFLGNRGGNEKRDVRLMTGIGAAFGGLALLLLSLQLWT